MPDKGGTLEEAFAQADAQINNQEGDTTEETVEEEVVEETTTESESEPAESEEDNQESFTKVNPKELPEELQGVYKSLQADYTRKTQDLAEKRKSIDSRVKELEEQLAELENPSRPEAQRPRSAREQLQDVVRSEIESEKINEFREQAISEYEAADPRLKLDSETYDKPTDLFVGQEMDARLAEHIESGEPQYTFDYKGALKDVLSEWDSYVQTKQQAFLKEQQKQAKQKSKQVRKRNPNGQFRSSKPKKMSLDEAIVRAQNEV